MPVIMDQEELQYEESADISDRREESYTDGDDVHLNETDQSIETELESIKGKKTC